MPTSAPALSLEGVSVSYGHVPAVTDVSFDVSAGRTVCLVGPNGAGKTTLLRSVCGQGGQLTGRVLLHGRDVSRTATHWLVRRGVSLVPEGRHVVGPLTVQENLLVAGGAAGRTPARDLRGAVERVFELFPPLQPLRDRPAALLSGGEQQMVAIGRALVSRPAVLLLDEPSMGLAPVVVETIYGFLGDHRDELGDAAVVLAEQNRAALDLADDVVVLSRGRVVHQGPRESLADDVLTDAYLGTAAPHGGEETPTTPTETGRTR